MPNPTATDVHVNRPLTNISVALFQKAEGFVSARAFPNVPVDKQSDMYYTYDQGDFNRDQARQRAPGAESAGGGYRLDDQTYNAKVYAFHKDIADQIRANEDAPLDSERDATRFVSNILMIRREKLWMDAFFKGGVWTQDYDGVNAAPATGQVLQWDDANSNPIEDVSAAVLAIQAASGYTPNKLILGAPVYAALKNHPDIIDRVKYGGGNANPAMISRQALAALFEVNEILVASAIQNTADEGQTAAHSFIGGKKALLVYAAPAPAIMEPSAGYTFSWRGYLGSGSPEGNVISRFRMEHLKSWRVEGEMAVDHKVVSPVLGAFWDTIVA